MLKLHQQITNMLCRPLFWAISKLFIIKSTRHEPRLTQTGRGSLVRHTSCTRLNKVIGSKGNDERTSEKSGSMVHSPQCGFTRVAQVHTATAMWWSRTSGRHHTVIFVPVTKRHESKERTMPTGHSARATVQQ